MAINSFCHYSVRVRDLEQSRRFYTEIVGLSDGPRPGYDFDGLWLYVGDHPIVHLVRKTGDEGSTDYLSERSYDLIGGSLDHVSFDCADYDATLAGIQAKNVEHFAKQDPKGRKQIFIKDPDGVMIELSFRQG